MEFWPAVALVVGSTAHLYLATRLASRLRPELPRYGASALVAALPPALFLVIVALAGRLLGDLDRALGVWAISGAVLGLFAARGPGSRWQRPKAEDTAVILALAFVTVAFAVLTFRYQLFDEYAPLGHRALFEQFRQGSFPVYPPPFPEFPARYHFGFDLVAGALGRAFGFDADLALDLTGTYFVFVLALTAAALAATQERRRSPAFAAIAVVMGAGLGWLLMLFEDGLPLRCFAQVGRCGSSLKMLPQPFVNLMQHPVAIGAPLLLSVFFTADKCLAPHSHRIWWCLLVVFGAALSVGQIVFFALGICAIVAVVLVGLARGRMGARTSLSMGTALLVIVGLAALMGGFFEPNPLIEEGLIHVRRRIGYPSGYGVLAITQHHVANFGLAFLLLPYVALRCWRGNDWRSLLLLAFACGGVFVPHVFNYARSWDIVKFPCASMFGFSMLYALEIDSRLRGLVRGVGRLAVVASGLIALALAASSGAGDSWLYRPTQEARKPEATTLASIEYLRSLPDFDPRLRVFARKACSKELAVYGGIAVYFEDYDLRTQGFKKEILRRNRAYAERVEASMDAFALEALEIQYVLVSRDEMKKIGRQASKALADTKRFQLMTTIPAAEKGRARMIWRVLPQKEPRLGTSPVPESSRPRHAP